MLLDEIVQYLQEQSIGTKGQNLFTSRLPDEPDAAVAVFEYAGRSPELDLGAAAPVLRLPRIQILSRAKTYKAARQKAEDTYLALTKVVNQNLGSTRYLSILPLQEPGLLDRDDTGRSILVFNCEVQKL